MVDIKQLLQLNDLSTARTNLRSGLPFDLLQYRECLYLELADYR